MAQYLLVTVLITLALAGRSTIASGEESKVSRGCVYYCAYAGSVYCCDDGTLTSKFRETPTDEKENPDRHFNKRSTDKLTEEDMFTPFKPMKPTKMASHLKKLAYKDKYRIYPSLNPVLNSYESKNISSSKHLIRKRRSEETVNPVTRIFRSIQGYFTSDSDSADENKEEMLVNIEYPKQDGSTLLSDVPPAKHSFMPPEITRQPRFSSPPEEPPALVYIKAPAGEDEVSYQSLISKPTHDDIHEEIKESTPAKPSFEPTEITRQPSFLSPSKEPPAFVYIQAPDGEDEVSYHSLISKPTHDDIHEEIKETADKTEDHSFDWSSSFHEIGNPVFSTFDEDFKFPFEDSKSDILEEVNIDGDNIAQEKLDDIDSSATSLLSTEVQKQDDSTDQLSEGSFPYMRYITPPNYMNHFQQHHHQFENFMRPSRSVQQNQRNMNSQIPEHLSKALQKAVENFAETHRPAHISAPSLRNPPIVPRMHPNLVPSTFPGIRSHFPSGSNRLVPQSPFLSGAFHGMQSPLTLNTNGLLHGARTPLSSGMNHLIPRIQPPFAAASQAFTTPNQLNLQKNLIRNSFINPTSINANSQLQQNQLHGRQIQTLLSNPDQLDDHFSAARPQSLTPGLSKENFRFQTSNNPSSAFSSLFQPSIPLNEEDSFKDDSFESFVGSNRHFRSASTRPRGKSNSIVTTTGWVPIPPPESETASKNIYETRGRTRQRPRQSPRDYYSNDSHDFDNESYENLKRSKLIHSSSSQQKFKKDSGKHDFASDIIEDSIIRAKQNLNHLLELQEHNLRQEEKVTFRQSDSNRELQSFRDTSDVRQPRYPPKHRLSKYVDHMPKTKETNVEEVNNPPSTLIHDGGIIRAGDIRDSRQEEPETRYKYVTHTINEKPTKEPPFTVFSHEVSRFIGEPALSVSAEMLRLMKDLKSNLGSSHTETQRRQQILNLLRNREILLKVAKQRGLKKELISRSSALEPRTIVVGAPFRYTSSSDVNQN